jgi:PhzF family phenazine biosynthesis protein
MKTLSFKKIDAFTRGDSAGNPAGYVRLDEGDSLGEGEMQAIARELKGFVSEVGYLSREGGAFRLRFYSSECEVAFCGHATIAIMYDLMSNDPEFRAVPELEIQVKAGAMPVLNRVREEDAVYITAPKPAFLARKLRIEDVAGVLGTEIAAIDRRTALEVVDGGLRTLIVPMTSLDGCLALAPDVERLREFSDEHDIDIVHVSTAETVFARNGYRTRVFAAKYGYLEDPATGSGNAAFGYYLKRHDRWPGDLRVEQGPSRSHPNIIALKLREVDGTGRILFGGPATTRIVGRYCLQGDHADGAVRAPGGST